MKQLTIEQIVFLWSKMYKYDHLLHGFTFKEEAISNEKAHQKLDTLKSKYGDLI